MTEGLTMLMGHFPLKASTISLPILLLEAGLILEEPEAACGVIITFSMLSKGFLSSGGAFSRTSNPAAAISSF